MSRAPAPPYPLKIRPFSRASGLQVVTRGVLAGPSYQHLARGAYWIANRDVDHGRRIEALRCVLPGEAVLAGASAA